MAFPHVAVGCLQCVIVVFPDNSLTFCVRFCIEKGSQGNKLPNEILQGG